MQFKIKWPSAPSKEVTFREFSVSIYIGAKKISEMDKTATDKHLFTKAVNVLFYAKIDFSFNRIEFALNVCLQIYSK